jgi:hypothetical protein
MWHPTRNRPRRLRLTSVSPDGGASRDRAAAIAASPGRSVAVSGRSSASEAARHRSRLTIRWRACRRRRSRCRLLVLEGDDGLRLPRSSSSPARSNGTTRPPQPPPSKAQRATRPNSRGRTPLSTSTPSASPPNSSSALTTRQHGAHRRVHGARTDRLPGLTGTQVPADEHRPGRRKPLRCTAARFPGATSRLGRRYGGGADLAAAVRELALARPAPRAAACTSAACPTPRVGFTTSTDAANW